MFRLIAGAAVLAFAATPSVVLLLILVASTRVCSPQKNTKLTRGHPPAVHSHGLIKISECPALLCPQPRRGIADLVPWRRSEIFDIVSALETAEGKGTTFYSFLNTTKSADEKAIAKAYRKRSLELQQVVVLPLSASVRSNG